MDTNLGQVVLVKDIGEGFSSDPRDLIEFNDRL